MNLTMNNLKVSFVALVAGAALSNQILAQAVSTPIVGFQTVTVPVGRSMFSAPLILEEIARGSVTSNTGTQVETGVGILNLPSSSQYYLEVLSGAYEGDRIDIDVSATNAAQGSTPGRIVLKSVSYNSNTLQGSELVGATVAVRKHLTLSALTSLINSGSFVANSSAASADQVQIYENGGFVTYYYFSASQGWYRQSPFAQAQTKVVPPGSAIMFVKRSAPVTLTSIGSVRTTKLQMPLSSGLQLVSLGFPVDSTLASLNSGGTWTANSSAGNADQILVFNGTGFETYYYFSQAQGWYKQSPFTRSTNNVLNGATGFLVRKRSNDLDFAVNSPITTN